VPSTTIAGSTITVTGATVDTSAGTPLGSTGWRAFAVTQGGDNLGELTVETWGPLQESLGQPSSMTLGLAKSDTTQLADVALITSEVQIYDDDRLVLWGIPVAAQTSSDSAVVDLTITEVVPFVLDRLVNLRRAGGVPRPEGPQPSPLSNGGFEDGLDHWTGGGDIDTVRFYAGTQSLLIDDGSVVSQRWTHSGEGTMKVSCQMRRDSATWAGENASGLGLTISATPRGWGGPNKFAGATLTTEATADDWVLREAVIRFTDSQAWDVTVSLNGPLSPGEVNYDAVEITWIPHLAFNPYTGEFPPVAEVVDFGRLVREVIGAVGEPWEIGVISPDLGVTVDDQAGAWDDLMVSEVLDRGCQTANGPVWAGYYTPTTRGVQVWAAVGNRGTTHTGWAIRATTPEYNLRSYTLEDDATSARSGTRVIGEAGAIGEYLDDAAWDGLPLWKVVRAPVGTPASTLDSVAERLNRDSLARVRALRVEVERTDDTVDVRPGDRVNVEIVDGYTDVDTLYTVTGRTMQPGSAVIALALAEVV